MFARMQELAWAAEPIRIWIEGGTWAEISSSRGFQILMLLACVLVPPSIIALGIGTTGWRETPLAQWFGFDPEDPDANWAERARDRDKDGLPDF